MIYYMDNILPFCRREIRVIYIIVLGTVRYLVVSLAECLMT